MVPRDLRCYLLACQWQRVGQEEAFPGRCAEAGDELGSLVVTARLARDLMRLCLLMRRRYPPYSKWLGTAFARLAGTGEIAASLTAGLSAGGWRDREPHLGRAYQAITDQRIRKLPLTGAVDQFTDSTDAAGDLTALRACVRVTTMGKR